MNRDNFHQRRGGEEATVSMKEKILEHFAVVGPSWWEILIMGCTLTQYSHGSCCGPSIYDDDDDDEFFFIFFLLLDRGYWMPVVSSRGWDYMIKGECRFMLSTYWAKRQSDVQTCHERIPLGLTRVRTAGLPFCVGSSQSTWDRLPVKTNPHAIWCTNHFPTIFFFFF